MVLCQMCRQDGPKSVPKYDHRYFSRASVATSVFVEFQTPDFVKIRVIHVAVSGSFLHTVANTLSNNIASTLEQKRNIATLVAFPTNQVLHIICIDF